MKTTLSTPEPSASRNIYKLYLTKAVDIADPALSLFTGHDDHQRRKIRTPPA